MTASLVTAAFPSLSPEPLWGGCKDSKERLPGSSGGWLAMEWSFVSVYPLPHHNSSDGGNSATQPYQSAQLRCRSLN